MAPVLALILPAGQSLQSSAPAEALNLPTTQTEHVPVSIVSKPALQWHVRSLVAEPADDCCVEAASQVRHAVHVVLPGSLANLPAAQAVQLLLSLFSV